MFIKKALQSGIFSRRLFSSNAFSVVNPTKPLQSYITEHVNQLSFKPSSLLIAVTPEFSNQLTELVKESKDIEQVIGVTSDAIPPASQRNALSVCFFSNPITIDDANPLEDGLSQRRNERGVTVGRVNWALSSSFFSMDIGGTQQRPETSLILPTANTIFNTGHETTMLYRENDTISPLLSSLKIRIHSINDSTNSISKTLICPLISIGNQMTITSAVDNMIKTIDNTSASHFLQSSPDLMNPEDVDTPRKVFAEVVTSKSGKMDRYEVIAGGGGEWSPRSSMLVLEPRARLAKGDKIKFFFSKSINTSESYKETKDLTEGVKLIEAQSSTSFILECSPVIESINETAMSEYNSDTILPNVFGMSSEKGFLLDEVKHSVGCELALLN